MGNVGRLASTLGNTSEGEGVDASVGLSERGDVAGKRFSTLFNFAILDDIILFIFFQQVEVMAASYRANEIPDHDGGALNVFLAAASDANIPHQVGGACSPDHVRLINCNMSACIAT